RRSRSQSRSSGSQRGRFISFRTWQALVVTELAPAHHSTEKSQGSLTTYRLMETLSWRYWLRRGWSPISVPQANRAWESLPASTSSVWSLATAAGHGVRARMWPLLPATASGRARGLRAQLCEALDSPP
uniref:Uncharacterized protein n=1 Tax=Pelusios castaneus TaxID=367368 RepID=A0A8C8VJH4_9SAUR